MTVRVLAEVSIASEGLQHSIACQILSHVGTLFVLKKKKTTPVDELLVAIRDRDESRIFRLVNELKAAPPVSAPAKSAIIKGKWRLLWSKAGESANGLQTSLVGQVRLAYVDLMLTRSMVL
jgi:hypothetical protein